MLVFSKTDIGKARDINEDFYVISEENSEYKLYILADGMGGYNGGEIASRLATFAAKEYIEKNFSISEHTKENLQDLIRKAIEYANSKIEDRAYENNELEQMGTTIEICLLFNNRVYIGHVGDSRIYRIRKDIIRKLTKDHSYVQKLVEDGTITKEEAAIHPKKNMLINALGCKSFSKPDIMVKNFLKDDIILMCSDGLTNMVKESEIYNIIKKENINPAEELVKEANKNGGIDNISVIIIKNI